MLTKLMLMLMERVYRDRMTESRDELARMLGEDELRDAVLLVIQNSHNRGLDTRQSSEDITTLGQFCATIRNVHATFPEPKIKALSQCNQLGRAVYNAASFKVTK